MEFPTDLDGDINLNAMRQLGVARDGVLRCLVDISVILEFRQPQG